MSSRRPCLTKFKLRAYTFSCGVLFRGSVRRLAMEQLGLVAELLEQLRREEPTVRAMLNNCEKFGRFLPEFQPEVIDDQRSSSPQSMLSVLASINRDLDIPHVSRVRISRKQSKAAEQEFPATKSDSVRTMEGEKEASRTAGEVKETKCHLCRLEQELGVDEFSEFVPECGEEMALEELCSEHKLFGAFDNTEVDVKTGRDNQTPVCIDFVESFRCSESIDDIIFDVPTPPPEKPSGAVAGIRKFLSKKCSSAIGVIRKGLSVITCGAVSRVSKRNKNADPGAALDTMADIMPVEEDASPNLTSVIELIHTELMEEEDVREKAEKAKKDKWSSGEDED